MNGQRVMLWVYRFSFWGAVLVALWHGFEHDNGGIVLAIFLVGHRLVNTLRAVSK